MATNREDDNYSATSGLRPERGFQEVYHSYDNPALDDDHTTVTSAVETAANGTRRRHEPRSTREFWLRMMSSRHYGRSLRVDDFLPPSHMDYEERRTTEVKVLNTLRTQPLPMRSKLEIARRIRDDIGQSRGWIQSYSGAQIAKVHLERKRDSYDIWSGIIKKISAYFGSSVASYFLFLRTLFYLNLGIGVIMLAFICLPQILLYESIVDTIKAGDFGELTKTIAFYGAYSDDMDGDYLIPLAYFLTCSLVIIISIVVLVTSMHIRSRQSRLEDTDFEFVFAWRLFSNWDHSITNKAGVFDRTRAIQTDFKEIIRESRSTYVRSGRWRILVYAGRVVSNILVLGLLVGSGYLIFYIADERPLTGNLKGQFREIVDKYQLPVSVAVLKFLVPPMFYLLVKLEAWSPRTVLKLNIARTTLFYLASIIVFVASLYGVTTECLDNPKNITSTATNTSEAELCCWENEIGGEVFKLIILDMAVVLIVSLVFDLGRASIVRSRCCCFELKYSHFDVATGVLDLVYGNGLIWLGLYFSPFLPLVGAVKLFILFYFRYLAASIANVAPTTLYRASKSGNFYLAILLLTLLLCSFPMVYAFVALEPSSDCGPFRVNKHVYEVVTSSIPDLPTWLKDVIRYIGTSAVVIPVIIMLILIILYFQAKSSSYKEVIKDLRMQLHFERRTGKRQIFATGRTHGLTIPDPDDTSHED